MTVTRSGEAPDDTLIGVRNNNAVPIPTLSLYRTTGAARRPRTPGTGTTPSADRCGRPPGAGNRSGTGGQRPQRDGSVGPGCLSQWWPAPFTLDGLTYRTAERDMMWRKAMLFDDAGIAAPILDVAHPHAVKSLGRKVRGFEEPVWERHRYGTGDRVLVEASPTDRIWGIGVAATDERAADPARWLGLNLLGRALMDAREILRGMRTADRGST